MSEDLDILETVLVRYSNGEEVYEPRVEYAPNPPQGTYVVKDNRKSNRNNGYRPTKEFDK